MGRTTVLGIRACVTVLGFVIGVITVIAVRAFFGANLTAAEAFAIVFFTVVAAEAASETAAPVASAARAFTLAQRTTRCVTVAA